MIKQNPNRPHSASSSPDPAGLWHVIREYNPHHSYEELLRIVIRRHLELSQEESGTINDTFQNGSTANAAKSNYDKS